jgi:hypothetical protein
LVFIFTQYFFPVIALSLSLVCSTPSKIAPLAVWLAKGNLSAPNVSVVILLALKLGISDATKALNEGLPAALLGAANT